MRYMPAHGRGCRKGPATKLDPRVRILSYTGAFNYSAINKKGVVRAKGFSLKFLTEAHEAGTGAKDSYWFCAGSRMEWLQARPRVQKSFSRYRLCQQELTDEKAPLFGLWRACWDNNPAF
jgi:hypothetical protein